MRLHLRTVPRPPSQITDLGAGLPTVSQIHADLNNMLAAIERQPGGDDALGLMAEAFARLFQERARNPIAARFAMERCMDAARETTGLRF